MHTNTKKIVSVLDKIAPRHLAESWDNVGLLVGNDNKMIENVLLALEVTEEVIEEAIEKNADMIITHHPLIYKPLKAITTSDPISKMVIKLIKNDINLFVAHTNLDAATDGTCQHIAELLDLNDISILDKKHSEIYYKLYVGVPSDNAKKVRDVITSAGAGNIGDYSDCTFNSFGSGTFRPNDRANPFIGQANVLETVDEVKIETLVKKDDLNKVLTAMIKAHPYEVPAYDIIKLENKYESFGIGRVGRLNDRVTIEEFANQVKDTLNSNSLKIIGDLNKKISKVSVVTGGGSEYFKLASKKSDLIVTGDIKYHEAHLIKQLGLTAIDVGHFETENIYMGKLKSILDLEFEKKSYDIKVSVSEIDINPFNVL